MKAVLEGVTISPVNMEERKQLGIKAGDTVRVHQKILDNNGKSRIQVFEGLVLARKHGTEPGATFTVRKVSSGVGVEKIYPLYSPMIDKLEIVKRAKVRRSKLYYIREKVNREIKRQMRRMSLVSMTTESGAEAAAREAEEAKAAEEAAAKAAEAEAAAVETASTEEVAETATVDTTAESTVSEAVETDTTEESAATPAEEATDTAAEVAAETAEQESEEATEDTEAKKA